MTESARQAASLQAIDRHFAAVWGRRGAVDRVVEGVITARSVAVVENHDPVIYRRPWTIVTRYQVAVANRWPRGGVQTDEFWVLGGMLPEETPPSSDYPRGERFSFEPYPEVGDHVLVTIEQRDLASQGRVGRVADAGFLPVNEKTAEATALLRRRLDGMF